jgi:NAD(P)-dependent dehydrogenase (short-subunit alcohol dehydrogenase family)
MNDNYIPVLCYKFGNMKKNIFITGVSSGIGLDASKLLLSNGFKVYGTVRNVEDKSRINAELGDDFKALICDITDDEALVKCIDDLKSNLNGELIYCLINNAGIATPGPLNMIDDDSFFHQMNVNLIATRKVTNHILPIMDHGDKELDPRIIFISSISGIFAAPFNGPYCISKHALECMIDIYRRELKYMNIKVVGIQPGPIKTEIWRKNVGAFDKFKGGHFDMIIAKADKIIQNTEKTALNVNTVSRCILNIALSSNPKSRYMIRKNKTLFKIMSYYMPSKWLDILIWKNLGNKNPKKYRPV